VQTSDILGSHTKIKKCSLLSHIDFSSLRTSGFPINAFITSINIQYLIFLTTSSGELQWFLPISLHDICIRTSFILLTILSGAQIYVKTVCVRTASFWKELTETCEVIRQTGNGTNETEFKHSNWNNRTEGTRHNWIQHNPRRENEVWGTCQEI